MIEWLSAYNAHNAAEAAALYAEDVTNIQLPWGKSIQGREAMHATYIRLFQAFPDIRVEIENYLESGSWAVVEWRFSGTMKGEFAGQSPTNRAFSMQGCEIFQIVDGKIKIQHGYWDKATMFGQLGLTIPG